MVNSKYPTPTITTFQVRGKASAAAWHSPHNHRHSRQISVLRHRVWALHRTTTVSRPPRHSAAQAAASRPMSTSCPAMDRSV